MKKQIAELIDSNLFFVALLCFVTVLPLSTGLVSVCGGLVLFVSLVEDSWENKIKRLKSRKPVLLILGIFAIYLISTLNTIKGNTFYDIQKSMFIFIFPLAFAFGKEINARQKRAVLFTLAFSVLLATFIALVQWQNTPEEINFGVHKASLISHIRFSFQLLLITWFLLSLIRANIRKLSIQKILLLFALSLYILMFLFFQQSLTGILALVGSSILFLYFLLTGLNSKLRSVLVVGSLVVFCLPIVYVSFVVHKFYDIEEVSVENIDRFTRKGNPYAHNFNNKSVENGHYTFLYICSDEMREEWNKVSEFKYDSLGTNGYSVRSTLTRYLTSKGLRKDAEGVKALTKNDISNIENSMANVIYERKFSLYPRIYQTVWEYYEYSLTGNANNKSFSQRIDFAKAAITIIKNNIWLGVGTGNWKNEFALAFEENKSQLSKELYASSHNQYLNYMVKFGLIGFLVILFLLIYPIILTQRYADSLFMLFLAFMFFANFADSNFESHMGSSFFFFFYCFFLTSDGIDYLKLQKQ